MAQQTFELQAIDQIGEGLAADLGLDTEFFDDSASYGVRDIVGRLPSSMLDHMAGATALAAGTGATVTSDIILGVTRTDGTFDRPARKVSHLLEGRVTDIDDMLYAVPHDPVWIPKNGKIYVYPVPTATYTASISAVAYPTVDADVDIAIAGFPDGLEPRVVDYMVIQAKRREMGLSRRDAQTEIEAITDTGILSNIDYTGIEKALDDANTEAAKIDEVIVLASAEFDKAVADTSGPIALANAKIDDVFVATSGPLALLNAAVDLVTAAVTDADVELAKVFGNIDTASLSVTTDKDPEISQGELQVAESRVKNTQGYLSKGATDLQQAGGYAQEVQSRLAGAGAYLQEAGAWGTAGGNYIKEAQAIAANVGALLQEAGGRVAQAQTQLQESGVRLQTAQTYLAQSQAAHAEVKTLKAQYVEDINSYIAGK